MPVMPPPAPPPEDLDEDEIIDNIIENDPDLDARYSQGKRMAIAGGVTMGVGVIMSMSSGLSLAFESLLTDVTPPGVAPEYTAYWAMFGVGLSAIVVGSVVMGIGLAKRGRAIDEAESRMGARARVSPWASKRGGGVGLSLRF